MSKPNKKNWKDVKIMLGNKEIKCNPFEYEHKESTDFIKDLPKVATVSWEEYHKLFSDMPAPVDLLILLTKYIAHVKQSEGIDFIDKIGHKQNSDIPFTENEIELLNHLSKKP